MNSLWITRLLIVFVMRLSAYEINPKLSGKIILSADECEISLSCQSKVFSWATIRCDLSTRASPERFSPEIGFFLWGIVEEPFCPFAKPS